MLVVQEWVEEHLLSSFMRLPSMLISCARRTGPLLYACQHCPLYPLGLRDRLDEKFHMMMTDLSLIPASQ